MNEPEEEGMPDYPDDAWERWQHEVSEYEQWLEQDDAPTAG